MGENFTAAATTTWVADDFDVINCSSSGSYNHLCDQNVIRFQRTIMILDQYLLPVIIITGLVGNLVSFLVFCCTYLRRLSSSVYLSALAVADFVFLVALFFNWINGLGVRLIHADGWCQFFIYVTYVASFLSVWYVVCFTVERHLTVCYPFLRHRFCQPKRTKAVVVAVALLGLGVYSFAVWTTVVSRQYGCTVDERFYGLVMTVNNVDTFLTLIVPGLVITVSNVRIAHSLSRFYRVYRTRTAPPSRRPSNRADGNTAAAGVALAAGSSNDNAAAVYSNTSYNRLQLKVTKMLLLVSSVFLFCNTPSHVIRVYAFVLSEVDPNFRPSRTFLLVQRLAMLLYYAGFSANVVLYTVSGMTFRLAFLHLFRGLSRRLTGAVLCDGCPWRSNAGLFPGGSLRMRLHRRDADGAYN